MLVHVCAGSPVRSIVFSDTCGATDSYLEVIAPIVGRLETLVLENCQCLRNDVSTHLRGMSRLREFYIGFAKRLTDDQLAVMLDGSPMLRKLTVFAAPLVSGNFLTALPRECDFGLRDLRIHSCTVFSDEGAAHVARFRGLEHVNVTSCPQLMSFPFAQLPPLRFVADFFCDMRITTVDLRPLVGLRALGSNFLAMSSFTAVDLSGLATVTAIGSHFLHSAKGLTAVDLSSMTSLTAVSHGCLSECPSLTKIDLSGLSNLTSLGRSFVSFASKLAVIDLFGLTGLVDVGEKFFAESPLERLRLCDALLRHPAVSDEHKRLHAATGCDASEWC